jgi:hypothetical protein
MKLFAPIKFGVAYIIFCVFSVLSALAQVVFTSSNLPIVKINALGGTLSSTPITTHISITNNVSGINLVSDPANDLINYASMNVRGSTSAGFPQKSYAIELRDSANLTATINKPVLGMPTESDWILYGPYTDKTFLRNMLTYTLGREMGEYAPRGKFVELQIDNVYQGVYVLFEKIKRDNNRVNISKLTSTDNTYPNVSGGYILKIDKFTGSFVGGFTTTIGSFQGQGQNYFFQYDYPKTYTPAQETYIQNYVDSFQQALAGANFKDTIIGYKKYINVNSFIRYFISNELSNNVDGYRLSTYLYKKKATSGDGKLHMGPLWDFNLGYGNADYCDGWRKDAWAYEQPCNQTDIPFWWGRLLEDSNYADKLKCEYTTLRFTTLSNSRLEFLVDSMAAHVGVAATARHYAQWPILGSYVWPNYYVGATYQEEIDTIKSWINQRLAWLDANMPGIIQPGCLVAPLALHNLQLMAKANNNNITLHLQLTNDADKGTYEIERSSDALYFTKIGSVNINAVNKPINFIDYLPLNGMNYYRLRYKKDGIGNLESNIVSAMYTNNDVLQIIPTVAQEKVALHIRSASEQNCNVCLLDINGRIMDKKNTLLNSGKNILNIETYNLNPGIYFIQIKNNEGLFQTKRFVKQ